LSSRGARRPARRPPGLEALEDRLLPDASPLFTVTTAADDPTTPIAGQTTLRDAINRADNSPGATIRFAAALAGQPIRPTAALPPLTAPATTIDGTNLETTPGQPVIILDGSQAASATAGLDIEAGGVTVKGLDIINWAQGGTAAGILVGATARAINAEIRGDYIGVDASGSHAAPNAVGVLIDRHAEAAIVGSLFEGTGNSDSDVIGGNLSDGVLVRGALFTTVQGDVIGPPGSGNGGDGVRVLAAADGTAATKTTIAGDLITGNRNGVELDAVSDGTVIGGTGLAAPNDIQNNANDGVLITGSNNVIQGNTISHNGNNGVEVTAGTQNQITGNSIAGNGGHNVVLPGGPVNPPAAPVLASAVSGYLSGDFTLTVRGTLSGAPNTTYHLDFTENGSAGPFTLGSLDVTTDGGGSASFAAALFPGGITGTVTATAKDPSGNTSSPSNAVYVTLAPPSSFFAAVHSLIVDGASMLLGEVVYHIPPTPDFEALINLTEPYATWFGVPLGQFFLLAGEAAEVNYLVNFSQGNILPFDILGQPGRPNDNL
jgi:parallel beta-helix repeat protein